MRAEGGGGDCGGGTRRHDRQMTVQSFGRVKM